MAGRFLFQKFSSGVSRSTSHLGNQGPASTRAASPVTRTDPAARDFIPFTRSHAGAKTSWLLCEMPLVNICYRKPLFAQNVRGARQTFSSSATNKKASSQAKMHPEEYCRAERFHAMNKSGDITIALFAFSGLCWVYMFSNNSSGGRTSCCDCQCHSSNPKVE